MKKIITISTLLLLLTGCGNTIICKTKNGDIKEEQHIKYNGNNITKITTKKIYKFKNKEDFKKMEGIIKYSVKLGTSDNVTSSYKKKNKKYILTQEYNISKMSEDQIKKSNVSNNKEEYINELKSTGLTCK